MIRVFKDEEYKSVNIDRGENISNLSFEKCMFKNIHVLNRALDRKSTLFPTIENVSIRDSTILNSVIGPSYLNEVVIEGFKTGDIFLVFSAMFCHVVLKGKIGAIKINKTDYLRKDNEYQCLLNKTRLEFYSKVDWALDISQAKFLSFSCNGIPANLIRRDSTTQFVVTRKKFSSMDMLSDEFKEKHGFVYFLLELFLESDENDQVLVTPLGKAKKYYMPILEGFQELRRIGILEPD